MMLSDQTMLGSGRIYHPTGQYRLRPDGEKVVLQLHERTRPMQAPAERWRDVTPQEVMSMTMVSLTTSRLEVERW